MKLKAIHCVVVLTVLALPVLILSKVPPAKEKYRIPVRVFENGKPVSELTEKDFSIYSGKNSIPVAGVEIRNKLLKRSASPTGSRFLVLEFQLSHYTEQVKSGIDFICDEILQENDRLLVAANNATLYYESIPDKENLRAVLHRVVKEQCDLTRKQMDADILNIDQFADEIRDKAKRNVDKNATLGWGKGLHPHYYMKFFKFALEKYLDMSLGYKRKYLLPAVYRYHDLAGRLEGAPGEKWLISFYQLPALPKLSSRNRDMIRDWIKELSKREWLDEMDYTKKIERLQGLIDDVFVVSGSVAENFFNEIVKMFYKGNITYHSVYLDTPRKRRDEKRLLFKRDIDNSVKKRLMETAILTGGSFCAIEEPGPGLSALPDTDSRYYLLTPPAGDALNGDAPITVTVNGNYRTVYYDNAHSGYLASLLKKKETLPPSVFVKDVSFQDKVLAMTIKDYLFIKDRKDRKDRKAKSNKGGKLNIRITFQDSKGNTPFDATKGMNAQKEQISLSLSFKKLNKGPYYITIQVTDILTAKSYSHFFRASVN